MIQVAVAGGMGRLGASILHAAVVHDDFDPVASLVRGGDARIGTPLRVGNQDVMVADRLGVPCDVIIDASTPAGTMEWLGVCERLEIPLITGVTGHDDVQQKRLEEVAKVIPVLHASNFSVGMRVLIRAAALLAEQLGDDYDIEVVEHHHRYKADAPSGSALAIVDGISSRTGRGGPDARIYGREGQGGPRPAGHIGIHAVRMGDVVGRHEVHFGGAGETVTLTHHVQSRGTFALGALRAAAWALDQPPGWYSMDHVLGLTGG
ncbi:MAG: 4-hydroxy-tetrahydrodipicolinate reductase [Planctomycetota bacterium]|jgi:4-hydroxy-tetrahydrodipicolinate reductase